MTDNKEKLYWLLALSCTVLISFYPLMMGGRVITDMIMNGTVLKEDQTVNDVRNVVQIFLCVTIFGRGSFLRG